MLERHPLRKLGAIYAGGVIGALLRVALIQLIPHTAGTWPWATFAVNMVGVFLIGYLFTALQEHGPEKLHHPFLATGICGALTTFAAMQLELFQMVEAGEEVLAFGYLLASLCFGYVSLRISMLTPRRRGEAR